MDVAVPTARVAARSASSGVRSNPKASSMLSLALVAKKKEILQSEAAKLEACLRKRTELLQRLRQAHEKLLTVNGHVQGRNRLRQHKLQALGHALEGSAVAPPIQGRGKPNAAVKIADLVKDLDKVAEKLQIFEKLVGILARKSAALEEKCMLLEEQSLRQTDRVAKKRGVLVEGE